MNAHYEDWKYAKRLKKPAGGSRELLHFINTPRVIAVPVFRHTVFLFCTHNIIPPGKSDCKLSVPFSLCVRLPYPVGMTFRLKVMTFDLLTLPWHPSNPLLRFILVTFSISYHSIWLFYFTVLFYIYCFSRQNVLCRFTLFITFNQLLLCLVLSW